MNDGTAGHGGDQGAKVIVRFPFGWIFISYFAITITAVFASELTDDSPVDGGLFFSFLIASIPAVAILSFLLGVLYSYTFTDASIRGQTLFGTYSTVAWTDVRSVEPVRGIKRLAYFMIPTTLIVPNRRWGSILIFTPMIRTSAFQSAIEKFAPAGNPARELLR